MNSRNYGRRLASRERRYRRRLTCERLEYRIVLAAVPFVPETVFSGGIGRSQAVMGADVDGDADPDLVALSGNQVVWLENTDAAGFGEPIKVGEELTSDGRSMDVTDIDGDGDPDVVVGTIAGDTVVWLRNSDGQGTFDAPINIATGVDVDFVDALEAADIDGDGDADVLAIGRLNNRIVWFENMGRSSGAFSAANEIIGNVITPRAVHAADMDGDGDNDVLASLSEEADGVFGNGQFLVLFENTDGAGTFDVALTVRTSVEPRFMDTADIDGDGDLDVVLPSQEGGTIVWYANADGQGTLAPGQLLDNDIQGVERVLITDLDQDGDADVVATADRAGVVAMYENTDGNGFFAARQFISDDVRQASGLDVLDLDGDNDLDVVSTSQFAAQIQVHTNLGGGQFEQTQVTADNVASPRQLSTADFDGDGDLDIVSYSDDDKEISWFPNDGEGTFGEQRVITIFPDNFYFDLATADMDGDGDVDIVASASAGPSIVWFENSDGLGEFTTKHEASPSDSGPLDVIPADIDGDGDTDILSANFSRGTVVWQENDGQGGLRARLVASLTENAFHVFDAGDFDGDGDLDVVVGDNANLRLSWFENTDGNGDFVSADVIATDIPITQAVEVADIDGDGDADVVAGIGISPYEPARVIWYENTNGQGDFSLEKQVGVQQLLATTSGVIGISQLLALDVDQDGDLDVVSPSTLEASIKWFENTDGNGTFDAERTVVTDIPGPADIVSGDLNGDETIDFAAALVSVNTLAWYRNNSGRSADFDGSGEIDAADIDQLCAAFRSGDTDAKFDLDVDGDIDRDDHLFLIRNILNTEPGDANLDGVFNSGDFVAVFRAGEYEDAIDGNSTWATGDWHCDGDFNTTDLVRVFQAGGFVGGGQPEASVVHDIRSALDAGRRPSADADRRPTARFELAQSVRRVARPVDLAPARIDQIFDQREFMQEHKQVSLEPLWEAITGLPEGD